jgi:lipid II:glycine glycyltransferase (peptidoglycan interpeptide bridge formation enzyme)
MSLDKENSAWNVTVAGLQGAHLLQTWEWSLVKQQFGWKPMFHTWEDSQGRVEAAALILRRQARLGKMGFPLKVWYLPRGPMLDWRDARLREKVLVDLRSLATRDGAIFIKMDPEVCMGSGIPGSENEVVDETGREVQEHLARLGWVFSISPVQFANTVLLDICPAEDQLLARMKQKTRYNIRLAQRKGVVVRTGTEADLDLLFSMYAETSVRDGFVIRDRSYYLTLWQTFMQAEMAEPLIAEVSGRAVAAVFLYWFAGRAYYLQGMSRDEEREKMPNYLLQWEAICRAKTRGCHVYDLWGAPTHFDPGDPLWKVYRFKDGLGGQVSRTIGAWDLPVRPWLFDLYTRLLPDILDWMRRRGRQRVKQMVEGE